MKFNWKKFFGDSFWGKYQISRKDRLVITGSIVVLALLSGFFGTLLGFYQGTGTLPFVRGENILPPDVGNVTTSNVVDSFVQDDDTYLNEYGIGFNCAEYAFLMKRNAQWSGVPAEVIELDFNDGTKHLILGFPTSDRGWVFINPEDKIEIHPYVGGMLGSYTVVGIYKLTWWAEKEPLEVS